MIDNEGALTQQGINCTKYYVEMALIDRLSFVIKESGRINDVLLATETLEETLTDLERLLKAAIKLLKESSPDTLCPHCEGSESCMTCNGRGWIDVKTGKLLKATKGKQDGQ